MSANTTKLSADNLAKAHELEQRIRAAFADNKQPAPENIGALGTWYDEEGAVHHAENLETKEVGQLFAGKHWRELAGEALLKLYGASSALSMMTPEAKVFFLPAYMLTSLYYFYGDTDVPEAPIFNLIHPKIKYRNIKARTHIQTEALYGHLLNDFEQFLALLSEPQKKVIRAYLDFMRLAYMPNFHDNIDEAMRGYWSQIDPD